MSPKTREELAYAWAPALLWLSVIAWESTPVFTAEHTATWLGTLLSVFMPTIPMHELEMINEAVRKAGHFVGYAVLSFTLYLAWERTLVPEARAERWLRAVTSRWYWLASALALLGTAVVAAADEWHQTMILGRTGLASDVGLDAAAGIFMQLAVLAANRTRLRREVEARQAEPEAVNIN